MFISYLAPHESHRMVPTLWLKSILTPARAREARRRDVGGPAVWLHAPQELVLPQKGQSKICETLGLAFLGGGFARLRLPLRRRGASERGLAAAGFAAMSAHGCCGKRPP